MPGAYDAISARIIERAGFPAILAGGYAANGAMLPALLRTYQRSRSSGFML